jgi:hypothetical protein
MKIFLLALLTVGLVFIVAARSGYIDAYHVFGQRTVLVQHQSPPTYPQSAETVCDSHMMPILIDGEAHCAVLNHPEASCRTDAILIVHDGRLICAKGKITDRNGKPYSIESSTSSVPSIKS